MKRYTKITLICVIVIGLFTLRCGEGNYFSPYNASYGATVSAPGDGTVTTDGLSGFFVHLPVFVFQDGVPVNNIDISTYVFVGVDPTSGWTGSIRAFLDDDTEDFDEWDDDGIAHYITDRHGKADVIAIVPAGFFGTIELSFDIGVDSDNVTLTIEGAAVANTLPAFTSTAPATGTVAALYTYDITTTDADGDPITLQTSVGDDCVGSVIVDNGDGTGQYTFTPAAAGGCTVGVDACDAIGCTTQDTPVTY